MQIPTKCQATRPIVASAHRTALALIAKPRAGNTDLIKHFADDAGAKLVSS